MQARGICFCIFVFDQIMYNLLLNIGGEGDYSEKGQLRE